MKSQLWHYLSSLTFVTAPFLVINIQKSSLHLDEWSNLFNIMQLKELELLYVNITDYISCWFASLLADNTLNSGIDVCLWSATFIKQTALLPFTCSRYTVKHANLKPKNNCWWWHRCLCFWLDHRWMKVGKLSSLSAAASTVCWKLL